MSTSCRNCPLCDLPPGEADLLARWPVNHENREQLERQEYDLTYCACGELVYLSPLPHHRDILAMYAETEQFTPDNPIYHGERSILVLEYAASSLVNLMRGMGLGFGHRLRVLEIGAGRAWICRAAKILDWDNLTIAQDLSDETVEECRWVDHYLVEDLLTETTVDSYGPFDVVSMTHVFEHLADPIAMLKRIRGLLAPHGTIFITAPYRPAGWTRDSPKDLWGNWSYHHVPAHLQYFSSESLTKAADAAGLQVARWDDSQDGGEAFEAWLRLPTPEA